MKNVNKQFHLGRLVDSMNDLYGFSIEPGFDGPRINLGPCGVFANEFYQAWNELFTEKINIVFIIEKKSGECWHIVVRLPNGQLFDGGIGVHEESFYDVSVYRLEDMVEYDRDLLDKNSYGLDRSYPRFCPNFDLNKTRRMIRIVLREIYEEES